MPGHRPLYHFQPPADWMNDPKPFFHDGEYHVFFQYSPAPNWGLRHWGHAVSRDLAHWEMLPIALTPTPGGPDKDGCWTGCVAREEDRFAILYTGVFPQVQCLAFSDDLLEWRKHQGNPVISTPPIGFGECFRDPCVWREDDLWKMIIGSETEGIGGAALLYESENLIEWKYLGPLFTGDSNMTGRMFECPDFFPLGGREALLTSCGSTYWHIGVYADGNFDALNIGKVDHGNYYAAKTALDGLNRRIIWGWITEGRNKDEQRKAGWSGALSLPRVLSLLPGNRLGIEPVPELDALRGERRKFDAMELVSDGAERRSLIDPNAGDAYEIRAEFEARSSGAFGLSICCSPEMDEKLDIVFDSRKSELMGAPFEPTPKEPISLRIFVDRSIIEVYANGSFCLTRRFYARRDDSRGLALYARNGAARIKRLETWNMGSCSG